MYLQFHLFIFIIIYYLNTYRYIFKTKNKKITFKKYIHLCEIFLQVNNSGRYEWNWSQADRNSPKGVFSLHVQASLQECSVLSLSDITVDLWAATVPFIAPKLLHNPWTTVTRCLSAAGLRGNRRESGKHGCTPQKDHQHCCCPGGHRSIQVRRTHTHSNKSRSIYSDTWLAEVGALNEWVNTQSSERVCDKGRVLVFNELTCLTWPHKKSAKV